MIKRYLIIFLLSISAIVSHAQWTNLSGPPGANVQDLERTAGGTMYMVANQKLFTSTNNGDNWAPVAVVTPANLYLDDLYIDANNKMYALNYSQVYTSVDGGLNWTIVSTNGQFYGMYHILKFGPDNVLGVYGWNGMFISTDDGVNWTKIHNTEIVDLVASSSGTLFAGSYNEGIKRYTYPGLAGPWNTNGWTLVNALPNEWSYGLFYDDASSTVYASLYGTNDVVKSINNGTNWTSIKGVITTNIYRGKWAKSPDGKIFLTAANSGSPNSGYIYYTANAGTSWTTITNGPTTIYGSSITKIIFQDLNTVYLGMDGDGVFKSTNIIATPASVVWTQKSQGLNFGNGQQIEIANTTGRILYINNNQSKGYWLSTTGGTTWSFVALPYYVRKILKLANGTILMYGDRIYKSTDNGVSFSEVNTGYYQTIVQSPGNSNLYSTNGNTIYTSVDQGTTWNSVGVLTGMPVANWYFQGQITVDNSNVVYAVTYDYNPNPPGNGKYKVYKITGTVGTEITNTPWISESDPTPYLNSIFVSNNKLYVCKYNAFYESSDQGVTWNNINFSGDYVFPITGGICVSRGGNPGSLYVTQDGGQSWNSTSLPASGNTYTYITDLAVDGAGDFVASAYNSTAVKNTADLIVDPATLPPFINFNWQPTNGPYGGSATKLFKNVSNVVFGVVNNYLYKETGASTYTWSSLNGAQYLYDVVYNSTSNIFYAVDYCGLYKSIDGGVVWTNINSTESVCGRNKIVRLANGNIAYFTWNSNGEIYVSTDAGVTFGAPKFQFNETVGSEQYFSSFAATTDKIFVSLYDNAISKQTILRMDNNGTNQTFLTLPVSLNGLYNISAEGNNLYIWGDCKEIYKSIDFGATWTDMTGDLTQCIDYQSKVYASPTANEFYVVGQNRTLYKTTNSGTNWTAVGPQYENTINDITWVGTRMVIATGSGVFTSDNGGTTSVLNSNGITGLYINGLFLAGPNRLYAGQYQKPFVSNDFQNWTKIDTLNINRFMTMPNGSLMAYNGNQYFTSTNGGQTWTKAGNFSTYVDELVTADGINFYNRQYQRIYYTNNLSSTWVELSIAGLPPVDERNLYSMAIDAGGIGYIILSNYTNNQQELYQVLFGSAIKLSLSSAQPRSVQYQGGKIHVFFDNGSLFETTDGSAWTSKSGPAGDKLIIANNNYYFVPQYGGTLWLSRNQGGSWQSVGLGTFTNNVSFTDVVVNEFNGYAYGSLSNSVVRKSNNIVIPAEVIAPTITAVTPTNNATGVSIKPALTITFDEAVVAQAAKFISIKENLAPSYPLVETIAVTTGVQNGKSFTFTPTTLLGFNKQYFITVDAAAFKDIFGNSTAQIISPTTWSFTTKSTPTVVSTIPANSGTGVAINSDFSITFSEALKGAAGKNITLYETAVPGTPVATFSALQPNQFVLMFPGAAAASQQVTVYFDATKGGGQLIGAAKVYAHAGVITSGPTGTGWTNVKGNFGQDDGIGEMTKVPGETNKWQITLGPTLRDYFNVPAATNIYRLALVFRNADGSSVAVPPATIPGGQIVNNDIFIDMSLTPPACTGIVVKSGSTLTLKNCTTLKNLTPYFIKSDALTFLTEEGQPLSFVTANNAWTFTTIEPPDTQAPTIAFTQGNFTKGQSNALAITVTDNAGGSGVSPSTVKLFYRGIMSNAVATEATIPNTTGNTYQISIPDIWLDELGLEFYFTGADVIGNAVRSPAGTAYHTARIAHTESNHPTIPTNFIGVGGKAADYKIFSIPYDLQSGAVSSIFSELGAEDPSQWRIVQYINSSNSYSDASSIVRGTGYWINTKTAPSALSVDGATTPNNTKATEFQMSLKPGWNLIGNPYPFTINWATVKVGNVNIGDLKTYNGSFVTDNTMSPFEGGFVFLGGTQNVTATVPFAAKSGRMHDPQSYDGLWLLPLTLEDGDLKNDLGGVGMHEQAALGFDQFDDMPLPRLFDIPEVHFSHPEYSQKKFTRDIVPVQNEFEWRFTADIQEGKMAVLSWNYDFLREFDKELFLLDEARQILVNMLEVDRYSFLATKSATFKVYYGTDLKSKIMPTSIMLGKPYPNPTQSSSSVSFTLPENAAGKYNVVLDVYDMLGNKMTTLTNDQLSPGFYSAQWNPEQRQISSGVYIFKLIVNDNVNKKIITEKLIIQK